MSRNTQGGKLGQKVREEGKGLTEEAPSALVRHLVLVGGGRCDGGGRDGVRAGGGGAEGSAAARLG